MFKDYLIKYGYYLEDREIIEMFRHFDKDNDGKIGFDDLNSTIGVKIKPEERPVFRSEIPKLH